MDATRQSVEIYETKHGKRPYAEWLNSLRDQRARQRIAARIRRLALGNFGDFKSVGQGVGELRIDYRPGYRVYFGRDGSEIVVLLIGGAKKPQTVDITTAQEFWADWKARKKEA